MPPDVLAPAAGAVLDFLAHVERRVRVVESLRAIRAALFVLAAGALAVLVGGYRPPLAWALAGIVATATAGGLLWRGRTRWSAGAVGALVERAVPESRNVVFTARELIASPRDAAPWIRRRVIDAAAAVTTRASAPAIVPLGRDAAWLCAAIAVLAAILFGVPQRAARAVRSAAGAAAGRTAGAPPAARLTLSVSVTPPVYTAVPPTTTTNPDRLEIIQGSRVSLAVAGAGTWQVRFGSRALTPAQGSGAPRFDLVPAESGYFAVERAGGGDRRLLPVTVSPDCAPVVRLETPGKDLLLPDAKGSVALSATASDDFGLSALEIVYTKVSGSGEQFEFEEGKVTVSTAHQNGRAWKATGSFDLPRLKLDPGDSLVYHAVARDGRAGEAGTSTSDTFFIEIAGPGQVALPGFELPPDQERYALSQQMIVVKLTRLLAKQATMTREAVQAEVDGLAAEQRSVRANFIFLMGGHVEDEEKEAEESNEIQEGRLENSARREIGTAIKFMGDASQALAAVDTAGALPPAKAAVDALQRAFGHNRYFLKTLADRGRIDPSRRLTGDLKDAKDWRRLLEAPTTDPKVAQARAILGRLFDLGAAPVLSAAVTPEAAGALSEQALAVDPGSPDWQQISAALSRMRDGLAARRPDTELRQQLTAAIVPLVKLSKASALRGGGDDESARGLRGAWADEARRR